MEEIRVGNEIPYILVVVQAAVTGTTHGLNSLLLNTPRVTVLKISSHLNYNRDISTTAKKSTSRHLDVGVSNPQRKVLQVTHS